VSSSDPRSWLDLAESDAAAARRLLLPPESVRQAAYLCQQAAEKATKALLVDCGIPYPRQGGKGHDLRVLTDLLPHSDPMRNTFSDLAAITPWATAFRYPSDDPATEARISSAEDRA
jgi:HEPN domain-containing protein